MEFDYSKEPGKTLLDRGLCHDGEPLISVITPFYNAGKYIEQTFNSVMNQTFPWFEWIIVDDGSADESSLEILGELSKRDDRIRVFHKENGGISTARNKAFKEARTEIVVPLDADDVIAPTYIEIIYWSLYTNPDCTWSYSNSVGFQNMEYTWNKPFDSKLLKTYNYLTDSAGIRKKDAFEVGLYDEVTKHYFEDWRFWLKMLSAHKKPVKTCNYGFWYRRLDAGVLSKVKDDPKTKKIADQLIEDAAKNVDTTVVAKEYPGFFNRPTYTKPVCSSFERKAFLKHDKTHVLMLIPWMVLGGADAFNLDICSRIDKEKYEIGIITTQYSDNSWQQRFEDSVTDIFNLPDFLDVEKWPEFISYYIKSREIDVLFLSNSYYGYYLVPWLRQEFPELAIIDYVHMEEWYWRNGGYARISCALGDIIEKTYVCNNSTRNVMIRDFGRNPDSVETLYIGVDSERFSPEKVEEGKARAILEIDSDRPIVLFPCRLHPQKRPFLMLQIAKEVKNKIPNVAFAVVGDGEQFNAIKQELKKEGLNETVYLAGRQADMLPWYRDCALTLICSLKEGLALTAYESLSMGKPVITSDVGGQSELIDDSVGCVIPLMQKEEELDIRDYPKEEVSKYADAIIDLLSDEANYSVIQNNCRYRIVSGFSSTIMIHKIEKIFSDLRESDNDERTQVSKDLKKYSNFIGETEILYREIEANEYIHQHSGNYNQGKMAKLMNSKWGRRGIKIAKKLGVDKVIK